MDRPEPLNRRALLLGQGGQGGLDSILSLWEPVDDGVDDEAPSSLCGRVEGAHGSSSLLVRSSEREAVRIIPASDAGIDRNGPATLADFIAGDEVFAQGRWRGRSFLATSVAILDAVEQYGVRDAD